MRTTFGTILVLLGCLLAAPAVAAYALVGEVTDRQRYLDAVEPLADDPEIQASVTEQINAALAGKVPESARSLVDQSVASFVRSDQFRQLWISVNQEAHPEVLAMLRGEEGGSLSVQGDAIVLDLGDVAAQLRERMTTEGVPFAEQIPPIDASVELISRPAVRQLVPAFDLLETLSVVLPIVTLLLLVGGVLIAARRGRVLIVGGIGLVVTMLLLVLFQFVARSEVTARSPRPELAGAFYDALTSQVMTIAWIACGVGGVAVIVGGIASAARSRRAASPPPRRRASFSR
ncbi:hypothetical protein [Actinophytocola glycyrrhizae]|uniref:Integral membrane protein n=1 Tax=Actinophytocola glycyrrhizae TaxID=2044873 RepID=A0ABV9SH50_9PSEU